MSSQIRRFWAYLGRNETAKGLFLVGVVLLSAIGIWGAIRFGLNTEYPVLVVSSGSMCPLGNCTLAKGDLIVIRGQDPTTIQAGPPCDVYIGTNKYGSIIVFRPDPTRPDYLVVHRVRVIMNISGQLAFKTQGDNNGGCDNWAFPGGAVPASRVVGVYQFTIPIPYLGSAILGIRGFMYNENTGQPNPQGVAVIVALIAALFAFEVLEPSKKKKPAGASSSTSPIVQPSPETERSQPPKASENS